MSQVSVSVAKPARKSVRKATVKAAPVLAYGLRDGYRPGSGRLLFAFTDAWLRSTGLTDGATVQRSLAEKIAGGTAVRYHLGNANLSDAKGALTLTPAGKTFFAARGVDAKASEAFAEALRTGKPNAEIGLKVEAAFVPLA